MKHAKQDADVLEIGSRVRTTIYPDQVASDWSPYSEPRRSGEDGTVTAVHDSHGLCYEVKHDSDGTVGCYEPHELNELDKHGRPPLKEAKMSKNLSEATTEDLERELAKRKGASKVASNSHACESGLRKLCRWAPSPVGRWRVTTEGDCEGRSTRELGTFEGHVADIALRLSKECFYSLCFSPAEDLPPVDKAGTHASVQLDIGSGTWDLQNGFREEVVKSWMGRGNAENPYHVGPCQYYAAFTVHREVPRRKP